MSNPRNQDPFQPWNDLINQHDPFAPHNDIMRANDPFEPWNEVFGEAKDLSEKDRRYYKVGPSND